MGAPDVAALVADVEGVLSVDDSYKLHHEPVLNAVQIDRSGPTDSMLRSQILTLVSSAHFS